MRTHTIHTQAPVKTVKGGWNHSKTAGHEIHGQSAVYSDSGKTIAIVYDGEKHAKLIAAAPEMLDALRAAEHALLTLAENADPEGAYDDVRAAIAKATE